MAKTNAALEAAAVELARRAKFQKRIRRFWADRGRHDLPWRQTREPWKLLIAEVLLRKTTAQQAVNVYEELSVLSPAELLGKGDVALQEALKPIGLSVVRSRCLRSAAQAVTTGSPNQLRSVDFYLSIYGIGRYIANSVLCCAYGECLPALDTNMIRVLQRVFGWQSNYKRPREDAQLWAFAGTLVPCDNAREYNWGVLDFGASICTAVQPKCSVCPLNELCVYYLVNRNG